MITMMGIIDFNNEMAPDIFLRLGDTGRETSLTPADPVVLEGLTASLYMAKPDNTFVIAACTISEDSIIIAWPEQAAAAKGFGEYCIRLKDSNDLVIYSARGNVIIDDHVITDSMIESIAEANGYIFPDDFATKDDIPDIEDIIDDDDIIDDKTWSSWKIDDKIESLRSQISNIIDDDHTASGTTWSSQKIVNTFTPKFSTTEQIVGKWIDNSPIYEKTATNITINRNGQYNAVTVLFDNLNIDKLISIEGELLDNDGQGYPLPYSFYWDTSNRQNFRIVVDHMNVWTTKGIVCLMNYVTSTYMVTVKHITVRYTKLT